MDEVLAFLDTEYSPPVFTADQRDEEDSAENSGDKKSGEDEQDSGDGAGQVMSAEVLQQKEISNEKVLTSETVAEVAPVRSRAKRTSGPTALVKSAGEENKILVQEFQNDNIAEVVAPPEVETVVKASKEKIARAPREHVAPVVAPVEKTTEELIIAETLPEKTMQPDIKPVAEKEAVHSVVVAPQEAKPANVKAENVIAVVEEVVADIPQPEMIAVVVKQPEVIAEAVITPVAEIALKTEPEAVIAPAQEFKFVAVEVQPEEPVFSEAAVDTSSPENVLDILQSAFHHEMTSPFVKHEEIAATVVPEVKTQAEPVVTAETISEEVPQEIIAEAIAEIKDVIATVIKEVATDVKAEVAEEWPVNAAEIQKTPAKEAPAPKTVEAKIVVEKAVAKSDEPKAAPVKQAVTEEIQIVTKSVTVVPVVYEQSAQPIKSTMKENFPSVKEELGFNLVNLKMVDPKVPVGIQTDFYENTGFANKEADVVAFNSDTRPYWEQLFVPAA
jgi:hypothetical protein